jgi:hypothetical protein
MMIAAGHAEAMNMENKICPQISGNITMEEDESFSIPEGCEIHY